MALQAPPKISARSVNFYYGSFHALKEITFNIAANRVTALIGPSVAENPLFLDA